MNRTTIDLWVGIFVAMGLAALVFLSFQVANLTGGTSGETYTLIARFDDLGGLKVKVGSKLFDASLKTKLDTLKFALKRA